MCFIGSDVLFYKIDRRAQNAKQSTMSDGMGKREVLPLRPWLTEKGRRRRQAGLLMRSSSMAGC